MSAGHVSWVFLSEDDRTAWGSGVATAGKTGAKVDVCRLLWECWRQAGWWWSTRGPNWNKQEPKEPPSTFTMNFKSPFNELYLTLKQQGSHSWLNILFFKDLMNTLLDFRKIRNKGEPEKWKYNQNIYPYPQKVHSMLINPEKSNWWLNNCSVSDNHWAESFGFFANWEIQEPAA